MNSAHENSVRCGSRAESRGSPASAGTTTASAAAGAGSVHPASTSSASASAATCCDLLRLSEDRLDRLGVLPAGDHPARQGQHQVVAGIPVGGEAIFGQLALDGEGDLQLLRH